MDPVPPPRADRPSVRGRDAIPFDSIRRPVLSMSHRVAVGAAVVVVSTVAVLAFVLTRSGDTSPPDGTYRLVARDSALCLTVSGSRTTAASDPSGGPQPVQLAACPDAGGPWGAAATVPAAVTARSPGLVVSGAGASEGTGRGGDLGTGVGTGLDDATGRWAVGPADGTARRALHPAEGAGLCLTVTGRAATSPVALEPCRSTGAQTWSLRQVGRSDFFQVVADQGRRCLGAVTVDGVLVAVEKMCSSEPSQQWRFDPAG